MEAAGAADGHGGGPGGGRPPGKRLLNARPFHYHYRLWAMSSQDRFRVTGTSINHHSFFFR